MRSISEPDWRVFRTLRPLALDRFCQKVLGEVAKISSSDQGTPHERYLQIYKLMQKRDREIADFFNDFRRSTALDFVLIIYREGLWTEEEFSRFGPEIHEYLKLLDGLRG